MSLRSLFDKDILIRLTENGFIETSRRLGLKKSLAYELDGPESTEAPASDQRPTFASLRTKRNESIS